MYYIGVDLGSTNIKVAIYTQEMKLVDRQSYPVDYIREKGFVEEYQNGANQFGVKKCSEVEIYNTMIKNYSSIVKQLVDLLPNDARSGGDELLDFISR